MMYRKLITNDVDIYVKMILNENSGNHRMRYFPTDAISIRERILQKVEANKYLIYVSNSEDMLYSYVELLFEKEEKYIQILAYFTNGSYTITFEMFMKFMKKSFPGFTLDVVLIDQNTELIQCMKRINAETDGLETMLHIAHHSNEFLSDSNITSLSKVHEEDFIKLHNEIYKNVYWNGERLINHKDKFNIFIYLENDQILAYSVISHLNRIEEEIYFLYCDESNMKRQLITYTLQEAYKSTTSVLLLTEENEDLSFYREIGFKVKEKIYTFHMNL